MASPFKEAYSIVRALHLTTNAPEEHQPTEKDRRTMTGNNGEVPTDKDSVREAKHIKRVKMLRESISLAVTTVEMTILFKQLMGQAQDGNLAAAKLLLEYSIGRPLSADVEDQMQKFQQQIDTTIERLVEQSNDRGY